jgi:hypothetical protein
MSLTYPNIVPENNLRLPDALTVKHGPALLLSRFVLEGDKAARRSGIRLKLRHDFAELVFINKQQTGYGNWYRLPDNFNPEYCDLSPENSYWISGENEQGEIVVTQAGRIYYWPESTLEQEARMMFYAGRDKGQRCTITATAAKSITGVVFCAGSHWIRPDFRGRKLSHLLARLGRAYAVSRWPVDWGIALVAPALVDKGVAGGYGYKHASRSIFFPASPWGDLEFVVSYLSATESYVDLANFMVTGLSNSEHDAAEGDWEFHSVSVLRPLDDRVTRTSSDGVFHGNNNRS